MEFIKKKVIEIVEKEIRNFINDFKEIPFKHRVEHSLHCELFNRLVRHDELSQYYNLTDGSTTQVIHKEWPASKLKESDTRRGNIDLVVLTQDSIENSNLKDFRLGNIDPFIAIELGLNYNIDHMKNDIEKLKTANSEKSYIIHLDNKDHQNETYEKIHQEIEKNTQIDNLNIAYISVPYKGNIVYFKHLEDIKVNFKEL
ncbi:hypothetical protein HF295_07260 [Hujiaoplasma nucleasis]|uniref:Uncharacterized protein n=1 Tax=Hujiaoplasma nucleasis TaxID=2725268 RepID=A0A7L6N3A3_9MOLU|nr:hypothetical protein [Hujiaoplasma nucleasis]QLY40653.1 hypothetical protein HF295_07260 [Hujiaoplasma nucleasis]